MPEKIPIGISGMGMIGTDMARVAIEYSELNLRVAALNHKYNNPAGVADMIRTSMFYGPWRDHRVKANDGALVIDGQDIRFFAVSDPKEVPWQEVPVDIVIDSTRAHNDPELAMLNIREPRPHTTIISSSPAKNDCPIIVYGINNNSYNPRQHRVVSAATCSSNCLIPVTFLLDREFDLNGLVATTVHAQTSENKPYPAAVEGTEAIHPITDNILPFKTGAAKTIYSVLPHLEAKLDGRVKITSYRVPVTIGSMFNITAFVGKKGLREREVVDMFRAAAESDQLGGVVGFTDRKITARHTVGTPYAALVSAPLVKVTNMGNGSMINMSVGYDNVRGFDVQMGRLAQYIGQRR